MMIVSEVPLTPAPQTLRINLGGTFYHLAVIWRDALGGGWFLDIYTEGNVPIVTGIPLVTGTDLLAQYRHLGINGSLVVQTDHDTDAVPTYTNLGETSHLYFAAG